MANGLPISAVAGRRDIMMEMEEIFFSGTFGGELLSLAAAKHVLSRHLVEDVCEELAELGQSLFYQTQIEIEKNNLQTVITISGHETWKFLNWHPTERYSVDELKTFFMQEVFKRGLLVLSTHNITLAHQPRVISKIVDIYSEVFGTLNRAICDGTLREQLVVEPLAPLFKVR